MAALLASAGVGIGLAMQGGLSNLAGGVILLLLKPFGVGDYIIESSANNEGTVQKIELFLHDADDGGQPQDRDSECDSDESYHYKCHGHG